jgi:hypothetical protein
LAAFQAVHSAMKSPIDGCANGVHHAAMEFIETPIFTRLVTELLADDEYRRMQNV